MNPLWSVSASLFLSVSYVASLYIWRSKYDRDHPETIKRRFVSAFGTLWLSPAVVYLLADERIMSRGLWAAIGVRSEGLLAAATLPLLLTAALFLGPLAVMATSRTHLHLYLNWRAGLSNLIWWRNHVVAPLTEELTFRACMLPVLLGAFSWRNAVVLSPLFFGVAHLHHMAERVRQGQDFRTAAFVSLFQMVYTTVFGAYSAFLFLRTGHLVAPVVVHGFCNYMGFPDFGEVGNRPKREALALGASYVGGVVVFSQLLMPLTDPAIYQNVLYSQ